MDADGVVECLVCVVVWVAAAVVCGACDVVVRITDVVVTGTDGEKNVIGIVKERCASGSTEFADAVAGAKVADTATSVAAAPAHAASEAIGASRRRARWLGRAGRMRRDTGRGSGSRMDGNEEGGDTAAYVVPRTCGKRILREAAHGREHREWTGGERRRGARAGGRLESSQNRVRQG